MPKASQIFSLTETSVFMRVLFAKPSVVDQDMIIWINVNTHQPLGKKKDSHHITGLSLVHETHHPPLSSASSFGAGDQVIICCIYNYMHSYAIQCLHILL